MKKLIGKILFLSFVTSIFTCVFSSCGVVNLNYKGKEIASIEYISVDYNGGVQSKSKIDFTTCGVYESYIIPGQEEDSYDYRLDYSFDSELSNDIINAFYNQGMFSLLPIYSNVLPIMDGGGWNFIITYADGTTKKSSGSNAGPYNIFRKADEAFFLLTGHEFLGYCDEEFMSPPMIHIGFGAYPDKDKVKGNYCLYKDSNGVYSSAYLWNNKKVEGDQINYLPYFTFADNYEPASYYSVSFTVYTSIFGFKKARAYSYTENVEDKQSVKVEKYNQYMSGDNCVRSFRFEAEPNKNYIIELELKYGTAEYYISTMALEKEEQYKLIEMIDVVEYDKSTDNSIKYRTIFTTGRVVKDKDGPNITLNNQWSKDYYFYYDYDRCLSDEILKAFNDLGLFDFDRYTESNNESATIEWELSFTYTDGSVKTYKTDNPEFKTLLENMDEAFFEIVGQYIFKWEYIK